MTEQQEQAYRDWSRQEAEREGVRTSILVTAGDMPDVFDTARRAGHYGRLALYGSAEHVRAGIAAKASRRRKALRSLNKAYGLAWDTGRRWAAQCIRLQREVDALRLQVASKRDSIRLLEAQLAEARTPGQVVRPRRWWHVLVGAR